MAQELKTWPLLDGFRGRPKADVDALVEAIVAFSRMAAQLAERLVEAEINPVFVLPPGRVVRAADGVVGAGLRASAVCKEERCLHAPQSSPASRGIWPNSRYPVRWSTTHSAR